MKVPWLPSSALAALLCPGCTALHYTALTALLCSTVHNAQYTAQATLNWEQEDPVRHCSVLDSVLYLSHKLYILQG